MFLGLALPRNLDIPRHFFGRSTNPPKHAEQSTLVAWGNNRKLFRAFRWSINFYPLSSILFFGIPSVFLNLLGVSRSDKRGRKFYARGQIQGNLETKTKLRTNAQKFYTRTLSQQGCSPRRQERAKSLHNPLLGFRPRRKENQRAKISYTPQAHF